MQPNNVLTTNVESSGVIFSYLHQSLKESTIHKSYMSCRNLYTRTNMYFFKHLVRAPKVVVLHVFLARSEMMDGTVLWARQRMNKRDYRKHCINFPETKNGIQPIVQHTAHNSISPASIIITVRQLCGKFQDQKKNRDYIFNCFMNTKNTRPQSPVSLQIYSIKFNSFHSFSDLAGLAPASAILLPSTTNPSALHLGGCRVATVARVFPIVGFNRRIGWSQKFQSRCLLHLFRFSITPPKLFPTHLQPQPLQKATDQFCGE